MGKKQLVIALVITQVLYTQQLGSAVDHPKPLISPVVKSLVLPGWGDGRETRALGAFILSCNRTNRLPPKQAMLPGSKVGGLARHWQEVCKKAVYLKKNTS